MARKLIPLLVSLPLPLYTTYKLSYDPQRIDVLTQNFIDQINEQTEKSEGKKAIDRNHVKLHENEIERNWSGSTGRAHVSFSTVQHGDEGMKDPHGKAYSFKANLVHYIWMYDNKNHVVVEDEKQFSLKPFDDTYHSTNLYHLNMMAWVLPALTLVRTIFRKRV